MSGDYSSRDSSDDAFDEPPAIDNMTLEVTSGDGKKDREDKYELFKIASQDLMAKRELSHSVHHQSVKMPEPQLSWQRNSFDEDDDIVYEADLQEISSLVSDVGRMPNSLGIENRISARSQGIELNLSKDLEAPLEDSSDGGSIEYETDVVLKQESPEKNEVRLQEPSLEAVTSKAGDSANRELVVDTQNPETETSSTDVDSFDEGESGPLLTTGDTQREARNFAMEHRIFLQSLLALLAQRDQVAVDMDDPNTFKVGPLKKATHIVKGAWKVKFVEIRRGMFSYYDDALSKDAASEGDLVRKNISLNADTTTCRAVKLNHKSLTHAPGQAVFELSVEASPRRFWMAGSRAERTAWIRAINDAMVGGTVTRGEQQVDHTGRTGRVSKKSPFKRDLATYLRTQREIKNASTKQSYVGALSSILGKTLNVPVQWISDQNSHLEDIERAFREEALTTGVNQLWKDLARDSVKINGELFKGGSGHAPERIIGALTREIVHFDRTSPLRPKDPDFAWRGISELQSLSSARDILLSGNRTRSGGDSYYCVDALCHNPGLVVLVPSSLEAAPLSVTVDHSVEDKHAASASYSIHDRSGWVKTRTRHDRQWRWRYFVLSEGTLSHYAKAHPRPYGLEGQTKLLETPIYVAPVSIGTVHPDRKEEDTSAKCFVITMRGKEGLLERQILFENEEKFLLWAYAFEATVSKSSSNESPKKQGGVFRILNLRDEQWDAKGDPRVGFILSENSLEMHARGLGFEPGTITSKAKALALSYGALKSPTVTVSVSASTMYNICTLDPQGNEHEDTWATVRATFLQHFSIVGGPNGIMNRSEEVVQVNVVNCASCEEDGHINVDSSVSPRSFAGTITRKLRRHASHDGNTSFESTP